MSDIDALLRELKKYGAAGRDCALAAEDSLALVAAIEEMREDAERYRWLRDEDGLVCLPYDDHGIGPEYPRREELDAAIDRARREGVQDEA